jgi:putative flippase GtrA
MHDRVDQIIAWSRTHEGRKLIRYTSVSVISTVVSQGFIIVFYGIHLMGIVASTITANAIATVPSYYLNRNWTWGKSGRSHLFKEIIPFWTLAVLGIAFSFFGSLFAKHFVNSHSFPHLVNLLVVMAANFISFAIFWVAKLMVFNRIFHVSELEEVDEHLTEEEFAHRIED